MEPVEYENYETFSLANEETIALEALHQLPLIIPQRALSSEGKRNWPGNAMKNAHIIATYNILSIAALLVNKGYKTSLASETFIHELKLYFKENRV